MRRRLISFHLDRSMIVFLCAALLVSVLGGYQLSQLLAEVNATAAQRSVKMMEVEERLDDASIALGRQIQEWKDLLLRSDDRELYARHLQSFRDASIDVQLALLNAKKDMSLLVMDTTEIDRLAEEHKTMLAEYLAAYSKLSPSSADSAKETDRMILGIDRHLQQRMAIVKDSVSQHAKQQMALAPESQGNRYLWLGILGAASLFIMALSGFAWRHLFGKP